MNNTPKITAQDFNSYLVGHLAELRNHVPGSISIDAEVTQHEEHFTPRVKFTAYSEHTRYSPSFSDPTDAVAWVKERIGGRLESEIIRKNVEALLMRAQALEAQGK